MIRIMHTALVFLFVAAALLGYGAKEETRALGKEIAQLEATKAALRAEIALLSAEWDHVTSADFLIATAARLDGAGPLRDAEGRPLAPWRSAQLLPLGPKAAADEVDRGAFGVATIDSTGGKAGPAGGRDDGSRRARSKEGQP